MRTHRIPQQIPAALLRVCKGIRVFCIASAFLYLRIENGEGAREVGQHSSHETSSVCAVAPSALRVLQLHESHALLSVCAVAPSAPLQLHESHALLDHRHISRSRSLLRAEPRSRPTVLAWERYIMQLSYRRPLVHRLLHYTKILKAFLKHRQVR